MQTPSITFVKTLIVLLCCIVIPSTAFALKVGDPAPLFSANSTQGNIQLADFKGNQNVVLALYFAIFTPV